MVDGDGSHDELDLLIEGGAVLSPAGFVPRDVGITDGQISLVETSAPRKARSRIDASGSLVLPGLIDMHTHVNWGNDRLGVNADKLAASSGVTTWVDAGSAGASSIEGLLWHIRRRSEAEIVPFINFSYIGLGTAGMMTREVGELWEPSFGDLRAVLRAAEENPGAIAGIKVRASSNTIGNNAALILPQAREAADLLKVPLMIHVGMAPPVIDDVMPFLKEGDLLTHCYHPHAGGKILDADGLVRASVKDAVARGVLLDVGHGNASISHDVARRALDQGFEPHTISSDMHSEKASSVKSLLTVIEMFIAFGMTVEEAFLRVTANPADALGRVDIGRLTPGTVADIAIVSLKDADDVKLDSTGDELRMGTRIRHRQTLKAGRPILPTDDGRTEFRDSPWASKFIKKQDQKTQ